MLSLRHVRRRQASTAGSKAPTPQARHVLWGTQPVTARDSPGTHAALSVSRYCMQFAEVTVHRYFCGGGDQDKVACGEATQPGFFCPEKGTTESGLICKTGHFCEGGSAPMKQCESAPPGYYCKEGTASEDGAVPCPVGHFCLGSYHDLSPCDVPEGYVETFD